MALAAQNDLAQRWQEQIQHAEPPWLCAWVQAYCPLNHLQAHWRAMQLRHGPQQQRFWLRLHEVSVWLQLQRILLPAGQRALFGPITSWLGFYGSQWVTLRPPLGGTRASTSRFLVEWAALQRLGVVNIALERLGMRSIDELREHSPQLDALIERGQTRHGLQLPTDLAEYAVFGWRTRLRFDEHPLIMQALSQAEARAQAPILNVLQRLNLAEREQIRRFFQAPGS